ncbi:MAG TPA: alpha/beta hydrolase [Solirubrobacterales bacterium]|nr:alpha/beta hydrolase [Solirubrobacterales bacterium]
MSSNETSVAKVRSRDGTTIAFDRTGDGPPLIFVGGAFQQRSGQGMAQLAALLAPRLTVYNYDRRGRGDSGDTAPYAVEREVEDLEALIAEAGGSAFVFGMSSGGVLALEAARRLPITRLAVYDPPFMVDDSGPRPPADHQAQLTELVSSGRPGDAAEFFMTKIIGMPTEAVAPMRGSPIWPALEQVAHTLPYDGAVMGDYSLPIERMRSVTVPTLVIAGEKTDPRLRRAARALWAALPDVQQRTLEGQTHEWAPEVLAPALERFFADSTVRGRVES